MSLTKKILKSKPAQEIFCFIAWLYIWLVYLTTKWEKQGFEHTKQLIDSSKPFIFVFWHGRLLMIAPFAPKKTKIHVVISTHNDGTLITRVMDYFGFTMIRGSSNNQDSISAFKEIIRTLKKHEVVAITPDGPRGPRMRINGNVIKIAQQQNVPIIPVTYSISKSKILKSWDKFILAKPFARGVFIYGKPILPCPTNNEDDLKKASIELENRLNEITTIADQQMGLTPIKPD